ncbi:MAG: lysophospholipid acyltransferase family protein [Spirochaetales bacterium]|nr:lysophospholipid acyltransferase family protein [Spirochaetales bacterium]
MRDFIVNCLVRLAIALTIKLDKTSKKALQTIPGKGPALLIMNHVSNIEGPVIYSRLQPRNTIALGKAELWDSFGTRQMMEAWKCIPITRSGVDQKAIAACRGVLERGDFLCIAPEGTRSKSGKMKKAKPGVTLFITPDAPVIPLAFWGLENYSKNLKKLRRTPMHIRVGEPFYPKKPSGRFSGEKRQEMVDDMMNRVAALMPEEYRGYYGSDS